MLQVYDEKSKTIELNPRKRIKVHILTIVFISPHVENVSCVEDCAHSEADPAVAVHFVMSDVKSLRKPSVPN
jgi:hypothetical protein